MKRRLALAVLLLVVGCKDHLPGTSVGTYTVIMKLAENTCGPGAVLITDGAKLQVELRRDNAHGYWHRADTVPIPGTLDASYNFKFESSSLVATAVDGGANPCQLRQDEVLSGSLRAVSTSDGGTVAGDAGTSADAGLAVGASTDALNTLVGTHVLQISGAAGTNCSSALVAGGGPFAALPCTVRYTLGGKRRAPF